MVDDPEEISLKRISPVAGLALGLLLGGGLWSVIWMLFIHG
jgi:hypothetical protein